jgi:hypothetical protein
MANNFSNLPLQNSIVGNRGKIQAMFRYVALRAQGSGREKKKREKKTENSDANPKH